MNFLFVAPRFHTNQFYVVKALIDRGYRVELLVVTTRDTEDHSVIEPRVFEYAPLYRLRKKIRSETPDRTCAYYSWRRLWRFFKEFAPDVVIIRDPKRRHSRRCAVTALLQGRQVVFYTQGEVYRTISSRKRAGMRFLMKVFRAPWISPVKGDESKHPPVDAHMYYVPFVIETEAAGKPAVPPEGMDRDGTIHIVMVGKYMERKNHLLLIRAVEALAYSHPVRLSIYGGADTEDYDRQRRRVAEYVKSRGLEKYVELKDPVPFAELQEEYRRNDLFVLPSRDEEVGVSILEAMAAGLPVICSDTAGAQWYLEDKGNGRIFRSDDVGSLVEAIEYCISDRKRLQRMGERSYELASTVHSPRNYHDTMMDILACYGVGDGAAAE